MVSYQGAMYMSYTYNVYVSAGMDGFMYKNVNLVTSILPHSPNCRGYPLF